MSESDIPRIALQFVKPENYKIVPATDVAGGPTPTGDIVAHFFVQHGALSLEPVVHEINEDGTLGEPIHEIDGEVEPPVIDRRLQVGMLLSPSAARRIGEWLLRQAETASELTEGGVDDGS
jgi:hypothetical protein